MRIPIVLAALTALAVASPRAARAQTAEDSAGIRATALDYIQGWYAGDAERMTRALHPALVKRIMNTDASGLPWIGEMGASALIRATRAGGGSRTPADRQRTDVTVLSIFRNAAVAQVDADAWVDYLQLVKWQGHWVILNVLWEMRR